MTAEFNEQVKKRHAMRIVKIEQEPVIDLSSDAEAETKHSVEHAAGEHSKEKHDTQQQPNLK